MNLTVEDSDQEPSERPTDVWLSGGELSADEAARLEERLKLNPDDWLERLRLLGYYTRHLTSTVPDYPPKEHAIWFIKNRPDAESEISNLVFNFRPTRIQGYDSMKQMWLEQVNRHPTNPVVLRNAARFLDGSDTLLAEELFLKAKLLLPADYDFIRDLANFYARAVQNTGDEARKEHCSKEALMAFEECVEVASDEEERFYALTALVRATGNFLQSARTKELAPKLLNLAESYQRDWNFGNAIFGGNYALAQIALEEGDIENAARFLLKASLTPGSPQLNSFGPNFEVAQQLLNRGEKQIVREYISNCAKFWELDRGRCDKWLNQIDNGQEVQLDKKNQDASK